MPSFMSIFADILWVLGLAAVLATFSYAMWYRSIQDWTWKHALNLPRILVPLCLSIEIFCIGLAMQGLTAFRPAPWWETIAWSILAVLFAIQTVIYGLAGMRYGWDIPVEGRNL